MMKRLRNYLFLTAIIVLSTYLIQGCNKSEAQDKNNQLQNNTEEVKPVNVIVQPVVTQEFDSKITLVGEIQANIDAIISGQTSAVLVKINKDKGDWVEAGDTILVLDNRRMKSFVKMAEANLENMKLDYEIAEKQFQQGLGISESQYKKISNSLVAVESEYENMKIDLDNCYITAPFEGVVAERMIDLGELVNPGMPLIRLVDNRFLKVVSGVPENQILPVKKNSPALIRIPQLDFEQSSKISWIGATLNTRDRTLPIEIIINGSKTLKTGMVCEVLIDKESNEDAIVVPLSVLQTASDHYYLFVNNHGKAEYRKVKTGDRKEGNIEVLRGLQPGDELITDGYRDLVDGLPINVVGKVSQ